MVLPVRRQLVGLGLLGVAGLAGCSTGGSTTLRPTTSTQPTPSTVALHPTTTPSGPVPAAYQLEYQDLAAEVRSFSALAAPPAPKGGTRIGTELLAANGNIGPTLLAGAALTGVESELNAFQALGVQGVTVDVSFPLLVSSSPHSADYLRFYEAVAQQVRSRDMTLSVEENPVFAGTALTPVTADYHNLTIQTYAAEQRQQAQTIIDGLHPDYLTVLDEPDTFTAALGLDLDSPAAAVNVVSAEMTGLRRGGTKVGAGTGSWEPVAIDQALLSKTSIDYLDTHVYPIGPVQLAQLQGELAAARFAHKPVVMDETWLYKPNLSGRTGVAGAPEMLAVDSYSFWSPLDVQYVTAMVAYVRSQGLLYTSFFDGARCFFGYLTWSPQLQAAGYRDFSRQFNLLVSRNMAAGVMSPSGLAFHQAMSDSSG